MLPELNRVAEFAPKEGEIVNCCVLGVNKDDNQIDVSLRPSRVNPAVRPEVKYPEISSMKDVTPGIIVQGYVKHTANNTLYVALSRNVTGRVFFKNLSNKYIKNPGKKYPIGKLVTARVISITDEFIDLSLKKSDVQQKRIVFEDLKLEQVIKGFVKRLDPKFGVFVTLKDCGLVGLCHLSEVDDEYVRPEDLKNRFKIKDSVKARIIRLNPDKKQISLTLKPSKLEGVEDSESSKESEEESDEEVEEVEETKKTKKEKEADKKGKKAKVLVPVDGDDSDDDAILNDARDQDEDDSDDMEQNNEDDDEIEDDEDEEDQQDEEESSEEVKPKKNKKETKMKDLSQRILTPSGYVFDDAMSESDDENYVSKLAAQMESEEGDDEEMVEGDDEDNSGDNEADQENDEEEAMEVEQDEESEQEVKPKKSSKKQTKAEGISVGFDWNGAGEDKEDEEESDDEDEKATKKKPVVAKPQAEETDGDGLNTSEDFEKALFANPNSSYLWIRFIAYWVWLNNFLETTLTKSNLPLLLAWCDWGRQGQRSCWTSLEAHWSSFEWREVERLDRFHELGEHLRYSSESHWGLPTCLHLQRS